MTDPGWDIPGIAREGACAASDGQSAGGSPDVGSSCAAGWPDGSGLGEAGGPAAPSAGSAGRAAKRPRRSRPAASVPASAGYCTGLFGGPAAGPPSPAGQCGGAGLPGSAVAGDTAAAADGAPAGDGVRAADPAQALAYLRAGLEFLANADAAQWSAGLQADCLRALAAAESRHAAAHARVLAAFSVPGGGLAGDGHRSPWVGVLNSLCKRGT